MSRLTFDPAEDRRPIWTPDGRRITFRSVRDKAPGNLFWQRSDGTGEIQRLTRSENSQNPFSWHPGGKLLAFIENRPQTGWDILILPMDGNEAAGWRPGAPTIFLESPFTEDSPAFSPDGRWIAYQSNESGTE